jgi:hypothetical protein
MDPARDFEVARRLAHVAPFANLTEKVRPPHTALLVVDMQNIGRVTIVNASAPP